jgi:dTDP-glucose 4,6-dehydratase
VKGDIIDENFIDELFQKCQFEEVVHLAIESHVDRFIEDILSFM